MFAGPAKLGWRTIEVHDLRAFTHDRHRTVDDRPFGGGEGMVLKPEPIFECIEALDVRPRDERLSDEREAERGPALGAGSALRPERGARNWQRCERIVLICGRYEGVDERVGEHLADRELSDWRLRAERRRTGCGGDRGYGDAADSRAHWETKRRRSRSRLR